MNNNLLVEFLTNATLNNFSFQIGDRTHMSASAATFWSDKGIVKKIEQFNTEKELRSIRTALNNIRFNDTDIDIITSIFKEHGFGVDPVTRCDNTGNLRNDIHELVGHILAMTVPNSKHGIADIVDLIENFMTERMK